MLEGDTINWTDELSTISLIASIAIGASLSLLLSWHYRRFGRTLSNRDELAAVFPFIIMTTILIISVVKSSLALSLGLVGALSIVRFRTPIKEPEELAYLFFSIAIGLGLGAHHWLATVSSGLLILVVMTLFGYQRGAAGRKNLFVSTELVVDNGEVPEGFIQNLNEIIAAHSPTGDVRRLDVRANTVEAVYRVDLKNMDAVRALTDDLRGAHPNVGVTFLDQNQLARV